MKNRAKIVTGFAAVLALGLSVAGAAQAADGPEWKYPSGNGWTKSSGYTNILLGDIVPRNGVVGGWTDMKMAWWDSIGQKALEKVFPPIGAYNMLMEARNATSSVPLTVCRARREHETRAEAYRIGYLHRDPLQQNVIKCWVVEDLPGGKLRARGHTRNWQALIAPAELTKWYDRGDRKLNIRKARFDFFTPRNSNPGQRFGESDASLEKRVFNGNRACRVWTESSALRRILTKAKLQKLIKTIKEYDVYIGNIDNKTGECRYITGIGASVAKVNRTREYETLYVTRNHAPKGKSIFMKVKGTNLCLSRRRAEKGKGYDLSYRACDKGQDAIFRFTDKSELEFLDFTSASKARRLCATAEESGQTIRLATCRGFVNQRWILTGGNNLVHSLTAGCARPWDTTAPQKFAGKDVALNTAATCTRKFAAFEILPAAGYKIQQMNDREHLAARVALNGTGGRKCLERWAGCMAVYIPGTKVTAVVKPARNTRFDKWTAGPCRKSTSPECTFKAGKKGTDIAFAVTAAKTSGRTLESVMLQVRAYSKQGKRRCVDITAKKKKAGNPLHQWDCNPRNSNQRFDLTATSKKKRGMDAFYIKSRRSGLCLEPKAAASKDNIAVVQKKCARKTAQAWVGYAAKGDWFMLQNWNTGKCLSLKSENNKNGIRFVQKHCKKTAWGRFFRFDN